LINNDILSNQTAGYSFAYRLIAQVNDDIFRLIVSLRSIPSHLLESPKNQQFQRKIVV